ncbi:TetR/AcrR family transcriptional regulator [Leifsonia naganoensis]|uniref:AcrR family transcriptional regulator n=1 Tax=Leifsonia naganoensis TaxID=150025 RepID=A0A853DP72_9MICO|nr:TetR/AcrR family transcriptional regulator [Leifsonia naganoensis]NYK09309.1 AcrR family transcriptional regulator [Leifsonia naganoensis]
MPAGRRERNKEEKQTRIFDAAERLFDELGFANVTTQRIADEADVAAGTVFRYAATKAELLMMVSNERSRERIRAGVEADDPSAPATTRILALITPLVLAGRDNDENTLAYQRELLFGDQGERYREEGLALFGELRERMGALLSDTWERARAVAAAPEAAAPDRAAPDPAAASRALSAVLHFAIADAAAHGRPTGELLTDLAADFEVIVRGYETDPTTSGQSGQEEK